MSVTKRKIIQIALDPDKENYLATVYALADDGSVWMRNLSVSMAKWERVDTEGVELG